MSSGTPWRKDARVRPFVAWRDAELRAVAAAFSEMREAWCRDWGLPPAAPVACEAARGEASAHAWLPLGRREVGAAWRSTAPALADEIRCELFGTDGPAGAMAVQVSTECVDDLFARAAASLGVATGALSAPDFRAWSGAVQVTLRAGVGVLLEGPLVGALLQESASSRSGAPALPSPVPVRDALSPSPIPLEVRLDGCELDLASLQDLRIGDVVRTGHALQRPARVETHEGAALFDGLLARSGARKAVELSRTSFS